MLPKFLSTSSLPAGGIHENCRHLPISQRDTIIYIPSSSTPLVAVVNYKSRSFSTPFLPLKFIHERAARCSISLRVRCRLSRPCTVSTAAKCFVFSLLFCYESTDGATQIFVVFVAYCDHESCRQRHFILCCLRRKS